MKWILCMYNLNKLKIHKSENEWNMQWARKHRNDYLKKNAMLLKQRASETVFQQLIFQRQFRKKLKSRTHLKNKTTDSSDLKFSKMMMENQFSWLTIFKVKTVRPFCKANITITCPQVTKTKRVKLLPTVGTLALAAELEPVRISAILNTASLRTWEDNTKRAWVLKLLCFSEV